MGGNVKGKRIALLGQTFKPNTDDIRNAPSISIAQGLIDAGAEVIGFDSEGMSAAGALMSEVNMATDSYHAITDADGAVIITEWDVFRALDLRRALAIMRGNTLIDLRNIYKPSQIKAAGFNYVSVRR